MIPITPLLFLFLLSATPCTSFWFAPWLCLERCGDSPSAIASQLSQLSANRSRFTAALFESYNLGPNATLLPNPLTDVAPRLAALGLESWAMISSYPYPPQFLDWMRQLFAAPAPFIQACISAARARGLTGFNVDWEPPHGANATKPTKEDAAQYAAFLNTFAAALHGSGLQLSVDVAAWSKVWDLKAIGATAVDRVAFMGTYTLPDGVWEQELALVVASVPLEKLVVGLESDNGLNATGLQLRFTALRAAKVRAVGVWRAPIPEFWWGEVDAWERAAA